MLKFDLSKVESYDILQVRSPGIKGGGIRAVINCDWNHTAVFVRKYGLWCIGEAIEPKSQLTTTQQYEREMNDPENPIVVRVWRIHPDRITMEEKEAAEAIFLNEYLGLDYPLSVYRLWIMKIFNNVPYRIGGWWCTRVMWEPPERVKPFVLSPPFDPKRIKKNPTPRTPEKRLAAGCLIDVTDQVIVSS